MNHTVQRSGGDRMRPARLDTLDDAALLARSPDDPAAFRELYDRYSERVYGYFVRRTSSIDASYDLTAETFAQAWTARGRFRDDAGGSAGPWLFGIARLVLLMSVRHAAIEGRARERLLTEYQSTTTRNDPRDTPDERWLDGLDEALADLPSGQRDALLLRVVDDLGYDDIATRLDTTAPAARVRVHRALGALHDQLTDTSTKDERHDH